MKEYDQIIQGNCVEVLNQLESEGVDLVYLDPPFFTQKIHKSSDRQSTKIFSFDDRFDNLDEYLKIIEATLMQCQRVLKETGSIFLHCDKSASHHLRILLDRIFGSDNFQSEIVWAYKRWSNSKKGLLNSHQIIFFYSKSEKFKFHTIYTGYSPTTNLDQILQERERDGNGKAIYRKDDLGNVILGKEKKGVPLNDVWEIPYLNPKARERSGYPTQKPVLLLNQIIKIATDPGDIVLDPFCGSGTTCVSAKSLSRKFIGIDVSMDAVELAKSRLREMTITQSNLIASGVSEYIEKTDSELALLESISAFPVQRNSGIDGFLKEHFEGRPVPVRIQKKDETLEMAIEKLEKASKAKNFRLKILIQTNENKEDRFFDFQSDVKIIKSLETQLNEIQKSKSSLNAQPIAQQNLPAALAAVP